MKENKKHSLTPGDVHVPAAMDNLSIRGQGSKKKKKEKYLFTIKTKKI